MKFLDSTGLAYLWGKIKARSIPTKTVTQAEYEALTDAEKNSETLYIITGDTDLIKGEKGDPGLNATINGVNTLVIQAGANISLSQEGNILTISASGSGSSSGGGIYSAEEQVIGQWIDGCPLYRKTVSQKLTISTGAAKTLVTLPEGCVIQRWDGYYVDRASKYPLTCNTTNIVTTPNEMGDGLTVMECPLDWVCTYAAGNVLKLKAGENVYVSADIVVTVEYTKTADQGVS